MKVRITHIDGSLPNLALMRLASWHRCRGDEVFFSRSVSRELFEPEYDKVYGSAIFKWSNHAITRFQAEFPQAQIGGTGTGLPTTVEQVIGQDWEQYDYSIYPWFKPSIGFTQRGCRLKCSFCVVPNKEGRNRSQNSIYTIWRGEPHPRQLHLLDNDFFGQPDWRERAREIIEGDFQVCFNQGINVRLITEDGAAELAKMRYMDDSFKTRRIYTAWDNRKDEAIFKRGIDMLLRVGIRPKHIMVYMLCGYWPGETMDDVMYRFQTMKTIGLMPYPMVYDNSNKTLKKFQRWVIRRFHEFIPWEEYLKQKAGPTPTQELPL